MCKYIKVLIRILNDLNSRIRVWFHTLDAGSYPGESSFLHTWRLNVYYGLFCSLGMDSWPLVFPQSHSSSQSLGDSNINLKHQEIINVKMYQR